MKLKTILTSSILICVVIPQVSLSACPEISPSFEKQSVSFAFKNKLLDKREELGFPSLGISQKFRISSIKEFSGKCLLTIKLLRQTDENEEWAREFEVIVYNPEKKTYLLFEKSFEMPKSLFIGIGSTTVGTDASGSRIEILNPEMYYVELVEQRSIIDAVKSIVVGETYAGFSGFVVPDKKLSFDPTATRGWRVVNPQYSLKRGATGETLDIQAGQLDSAFDTYFNGGIRKSINIDGKTIEALQVAPWGDSTIRKFLSSGNQWIDVVTLLNGSLKTKEFQELPAFSSFCIKFLSHE